MRARPIYSRQESNMDENEIMCTFCDAPAAFDDNGLPNGWIAVRYWHRDRKYAGCMECAVCPECTDRLPNNVTKRFALQRDTVLGQA